MRPGLWGSAPGPHSITENWTSHELHKTTPGLNVQTRNVQLFEALEFTMIYIYLFFILFIIIYIYKIYIIYIIYIYTNIILYI